eukprot:g23643.t1
MKNIADLRTLGICSAKWLILIIVWNLHPYLGLCGKLLAGLIQCVWSFFVMTMVPWWMHCDVFQHPWAENVWRVFLSATAGVPAEAYRPTHNLNHHVYTQHGDHLDTKQMKYKWHLLNLLLFFPTVFPSIQKLENAFIAKEARKCSKTFFLFCAQVLVAHGMSGLMLCLDWRRALCCWVIPYIFGADAIVTMNMLQHDGTEDCGRLQGVMLNSTDKRVDLAKPWHIMVRVALVALPAAFTILPELAWQLGPPVGRALHFTSRQLSPLEHHCASQTPSATFTLYLKAGPRCSHQGLQGTWECFDGFQGTMPALTWVGSCITFEFLDDAEMIDPDGQDSGSHMELFVGSLGQGQPCFWQRGETRRADDRSQGDQADGPVPPLVLVLTMGMFFGSGAAGIQELLGRETAADYTEPTAGSEPGMLWPDRDSAGIIDPKSERLKVQWPFGEHSREEVQEALAKRLLVLKEAAAAADSSATPSQRREMADLLCNLGVVLLLKAPPSLEDLHRAVQILQQSSELEPEATDTQHFLERAKILLRCLQPEDAKEEEDVEEMATPRFDSEEAEADVDLTRRRPLWRENTLAPDTSESHRSRQLQRMWLRTSTGTWLCKLRRAPVVISLNPDDASAPDLSPRCVEAMLHISSMLHDDIHQVGSGLAGLVWLLLDYGLRCKRSTFESLKGALCACPMPSCLGIVRHFHYDRSNPARDLETPMLDSLACMRCEGLLGSFHYGQEIEALCFKHLPRPVLSLEDQLEILNRRAKLLEMLMGKPPRTYTRHPKTEMDARDGGLMNHPPSHTLFRSRVMRSHGFPIHKASRHNQENVNINKSLSALGNVINALSSASSESLGGNAFCTMIATISPAAVNSEETWSTLQYAKRAKTIRVAATRNKESQQREELQREVDELRKFAQEASSTEELEARHKSEIEALEAFMKQTWEESTMIDKQRLSKEHEEQRELARQEVQRANEERQAEQRRRIEALEKLGDLNVTLQSFVALGQAGHVSWPQRLASVLRLPQQLLAQQQAVRLYREGAAAEVKELLEKVQIALK